MTDDATAGPEGAAPINHPRDLPKRKMSLLAQAAFLSRLEDRCKMHGPERRGEWAGEATLALTAEDMAALCCIRDTIQTFDFYGAADFVKSKAAKRAEKSGKR